MFEKLIESLLGSWGSVVLEFVVEHQLIISIVVVVWGASMIIIRRRKKKENEK